MRINTLRNRDLPSGYCTNETESRVFPPEDMLVEVWKTIVANRFGEFGEERHRPSIACAKDDVINLFQFRPIFEKYCSLICFPI